MPFVNRYFAGRKSTCNHPPGYLNPGGRFINLKTIITPRLILLVLNPSNIQTPAVWVMTLKFTIMKKRFVAFALLIGAIVSVTSGCYVEDGYGYHHEYHHHHYHDRD